MPCSADGPIAVAPGDGFALRGRRRIHAAAAWSSTRARAAVPRRLTPARAAALAAPPAGSPDARLDLHGAGRRAGRWVPRGT